MSPAPAMILEGEPMQAIIKKFESTDAWILPVVDINLVYKGFIMRNRIFEHYRKKVALMRSENKNAM
jgi:CIC family chloride channel protein